MQPPVDDLPPAYQKSRYAKAQTNAASEGWRLMYSFREVRKEEQAHLEFSELSPHGGLKDAHVNPFSLLCCLQTYKVVDVSPHSIYVASQRILHDSKYTTRCV